MNTEPILIFLNEKKLIGLDLSMSLTEDRTPFLWKSFMMRRSEIRATTGKEFYSLQEYPPGYFANFRPDAVFRKWAAVEVANFEAVPPGMKTTTVPAGTYAVFLFTGPASGASEFFEYIFDVWLRSSEFILDDRPHFEVLPPDYNPADAAATEEIWIPIRTPKK